MDFHETCRLNNAAVEAGFEALLVAAAGASKAALTHFADFVKAAGRVGINMRPMVLLDFLNHDRLLNIHEWASAFQPGQERPRKTPCARSWAHTTSAGWPSTTILTGVPSFDT